MTRTLTTGSPSEDVPHCHYTDEAVNDDPALTPPEHSSQVPPVEGTSAREEHKDASGMESVSTLHSPSDRVMLSRTNSMPSDHHRSDRHPRATNSSSPFDYHQSLHVNTNLRPPPPGNLPSSSFQERSAFPLKSETEAILFRHYIAKLAVCVGQKN